MLRGTAVKMVASRKAAPGDLGVLMRL